MNVKGICIVMLCLGFCVVSASGCSTLVSAQIKPQSAFDYPNSNVYPLGKVQGKASKAVFGIMAMPTSKIREAAVQNALSQKQGADLLVNYTETARNFMIPPIPICFLTVKVEGTAAKMDIGEQAIK